MLNLDDESCIERGICSDILPQYFEVDEGRVRIRKDLDAAGFCPDSESLSQAMRDCPAGSIKA